MPQIFTPSERSWNDFFAVAGQVYNGDPCYSAPNRAAELASLERADYAGRQRVLLAYDAGRPAARLVARVSPSLRDDAGRPYGLLGFFEALDRPDLVEQLFHEAVAWLRDQGAGTLVGPMDGDTWHRYRLNVGPWDERPFLMEPYNPPYYPGLWDTNGFEPLEEYCSKRLDDLAGAVDGLDEGYRSALERGYRFERLRLDRYEDELRRFYRLCVEIFRDNFLYSEITEERFLGLYRGARRLIDPDFVVFAVAPDGTDAGFLFAFPDDFDAVAALRGRTSWLAAARFLWARRRRPDTVNLKSLGVVPAHRRARLGGALMCHAYRTAQEKGYRRANLCLILAGNPSGRLEAGLGRVLRSYRLYRYKDDA